MSRGVTPLLYTVLPGRKFDRQLFEKGRPEAIPWYDMVFQLAEVEVYVYISRME